MKNLNELLKNINDNVEKYFIENFNFEDLGENFVLDIESCGLNNNTECLVYSIAIMDIDDNLNNCYVFRSVHQFMETIINAKKEINFYIHNLSFDIKPFLISFIPGLAQWVRDPALPELWCWSQMQLRSCVAVAVA